MMFSMLEENDLEKKVEKNKKALDALSIQNASLDQDVEGLFKELKVTPEQISTFVKNEKNFTPDNWEFLQKEQKRQDEKLLLSLAQVSNPKNVKNKRAQQSIIQQHWLFVR